MKRIVVLVMVVAVLLGACASGDGDDRDRAAPDADAAPDAEGAAGDTASLLGMAASEVAGRDVVSTAQQEVAVDDVGQASDDALDVVASAGGFLFGEQSDFRDSIEAELTFKVPPTEFGATLDRLGELGALRSQSVATDDVTEQIVDLDSRIESAAASVARLRGFLDEAGSIDQLATVEGELLARETELEQLEAAKRTIEADVSMATVTLTLVETPVEGAARVGFLDGLAGGWGALQDGLAVALLLTGALLPFAPFALVALVVARYVSRRRNPVAS
jgi:hypothetical protein